MTAQNNSERGIISVKFVITVFLGIAIIVIFPRIVHVIRESMLNRLEHEAQALIIADADAKPGSMIPGTTRTVCDDIFGNLCVDAIATKTPTLDECGEFQLVRDGVKDDRRFPICLKGMENSNQDNP